MTEATEAFDGAMTPPHDSYWVLPGQLLAGPYPGGPSEGAMRAALDAFRGVGVTLFVDLTEEGELAPYDHLLEGTGTRHVRMPVRDFGVPARERARETVALVRTALDEGEVVYVHCRGGAGRTGTIVGCLLVEQGTPPNAAIEHIARLREGLDRGEWRSPETSEQRAFIERWQPR